MSPLKAAISILLAITAVLITNGFAAQSQVAMVILTFITGVIAMSVCAPIQVILISYSQEAEMFGASLGQSSFNIGNALGAFLGGIPLAMGYSYSSPQWVGACLSFSGVLLAILLFYRSRHRNIVMVQTPLVH
jgi:DHA1 family arabinose polymer transporter-like MFS transporter